jgi:hypothetical protein
MRGSFSRGLLNIPLLVRTPRGAGERWIPAIALDISLEFPLQ